MAVTLVTAGAEKASNLPIPPIAFSIMALAFFGFLLLVTFAFRSVGTRH